MKKEKFFTIYDAFCAIFYALIIFVGVNMCFDHGRSADIYDLVIVTVSIVTVFVMKLLKRKFTDIDDGVGSIVFSGLMSLIGASLLIIKIFA